ncbi:BMP and activin membrane-bound inhibitor homolog [Uloborus diversus]|uniref:BMP and activin membrane-bound inhibitor homolog n=1 Tax=Uloborus diversus TaxID=327109 RepID=UPI00240A2B4B|nr:BMP and activin membrane-bound inhibitor homolog [Uloborus diversus]
MDRRPGDLAVALFIVLVFMLSCVKAEIRCFCNQAACVSTGYMCKSSAQCFSDVEGGIHGCLERKRCNGLRCCREDMCNYIHVDIHVHTHRAPMAGALGESLDTDSERIAIMESALRREVWFKAAVIAVPIGGMCVLVLLAVVAARMLRQDAIRQKRLLELRRIYSYSLKDTLLPWGKEKNTTIV